jgi:hypothetical protein
MQCYLSNVHSRLYNRFADVVVISLARFEREVVIHEKRLGVVVHARDVLARRRQLTPTITTTTTTGDHSPPRLTTLWLTQRILLCARPCHRSTLRSSPPPRQSALHSKHSTHTHAHRFVVAHECERALTLDVSVVVGKLGRLLTHRRQLALHSLYNTHVHTRVMPDAVHDETSQRTVAVVCSVSFDAVTLVIISSPIAYSMKQSLQ